MAAIDTYFSRSHSYKMKYFIACLLLSLRYALTLAAECNLDQSNHCVFFVAAYGELCEQNVCDQKYEPSCIEPVQVKCNDFLDLGGVSCTYTTENPYFICDA